jgi:hypothetical protein
MNDLNQTVHDPGWKASPPVLLNPRPDRLVATGIFPTVPPVQSPVNCRQQDSQAERLLQNGHRTQFSRHLHEVGAAMFSATAHGIAKRIA